MSNLLQFIFSGLTIGALYAIVALGFTLIYNSSQVVNFAQGEFVMLGAMSAIFLMIWGLPFSAAVVLAVVATAAIGFLLYVLAIRPMAGASEASLVIVTIGASILMRGIAQVVFDKNLHNLDPFSGERPIVIGGAVILPQVLWVIGGTAIVVALLASFLTATVTGKAVLATAANRLAAQLVGINTRRIVALCFAVSAAIGAIGGILMAPIIVASYSMGTMLALKGFSAAMLGGMGSPGGAVLGGILLGLLESLAAGYVSSAYKDAVAFLVIVVVLLVAPNGLLGRRPVERV